MVSVLCACSRRFLEEELARRYRDAAPATLALLQVCTLSRFAGRHVGSVWRALAASLCVACLTHASLSHRFCLPFHAGAVRERGARAAGRRPQAAGGGGCGVAAQGRCVRGEAGAEVERRGHRKPAGPAMLPAQLLAPCSCHLSFVSTSLQPVFSHPVRAGHCRPGGGYPGGLPPDRPHAVRLDDRGGAVIRHRQQREQLRTDGCCGPRCGPAVLANSPGADCTPLTAPACSPASLTQWPGVTAVVKPANAGLRLFGGAAFERVLQVRTGCLL